MTKWLTKLEEMMDAEAGIYRVIRIGGDGKPRIGWGRLELTHRPLAGATYGTATFNFRAIRNTEGFGNAWERFYLYGYRNQNVTYASSILAIQRVTDPALLEKAEHLLAAKDNQKVVIENGRIFTGETPAETETA